MKPITNHHHPSESKPTNPLISSKLQSSRNDDWKHGECLRNHAASLGRHAVDGCRDFISSPSSSYSNPSSLTCAACGCHRNFHRRLHTNAKEEEEEDGGSGMKNDGEGPHRHVRGPAGKKKKRSKFSEEQKRGMRELAERVGWRLQGMRDGGVVMDGCRRIGVEREVFKVWMHNNKHSINLGPKKFIKREVLMASSNGDDTANKYY